MLHKEKFKKFFFAFVATSISFPIVFINKILFALCIATACGYRIDKKNEAYTRTLATLCIVMLYGTILAIFCGVEVSNIIKPIFSILILLLIIPIRKLDIHVDNILYISVNALLFLSIIYVICAYTSADPAANYFIILLNEYAGNDIVVRNYIDGESLVTITPLGGAPVLFVGYCIAVQRLIKEWKPFTIALIAAYLVVLLLNGSRGIIACVLVYSIFCFRNKLKKNIIYCAALALLMIFLALKILGTNLVSTEEESNLYKINLLASYFEQLDVLKFFFGSGIGNPFYNLQKNEFQSHSENNFLDMCRWVGVPLAILFYSKLICPTGTNCLRGAIDLDVFVCYLLICILSLSNPVLLNSNGYIITLWYWSKYRRNDS